ncbi:hypothetical protein [Metamycoplasma alkalescens]|nr:hypothetical protein [Metamycoplasma alkalescens]
MKKKLGKDIFNSDILYVFVVFLVRNQIADYNFLFKENKNQ